MVIHNMTEEEAARIPDVDAIHFDQPSMKLIATALLRMGRGEVFCVAPRDDEASRPCGHGAWDHAGNACLRCRDEHRDNERRYGEEYAEEFPLTFSHKYRAGRICLDAAHPDKWNGDLDAACPRCHMFDAVLLDGSEVVSREVLHGLEISK